MITDLAEALALLQAHAEEARALAHTLIASIDSNSDEELSQRFEKLLANEVSGYSVSAEADSFYTAEADQVDMDLVEFRFLSAADDFDFSVVRSGPNELAVQANIEAAVEAEATFSLSVYDSIDKDYMGIGFANAKTTSDVEFAILATFDRETPTESFKITKLEIVSGPRTVDFGFVEPDYEPDYDEDDYQRPENPMPPANPDDDIPW